MENEELRDANLPAIADDFLVQVADQAERRIDAVMKIKRVALKITNARDWTDQQGNPYLQASGSEKVANLFNISWRIDEPQVIEDPDGHYTYSYKGYFSLGSRTIEAEGSRSSRDGFFNQYRYEEKENGKKDKIEIPVSKRTNKRDVKMAALTNLLGNGITRILGIRNLTWEDLKEFANITQDQVKAIQYRKGGEKLPIQEPQKKQPDGKPQQTGKPQETVPPSEDNPPIVTTTIKEVRVTHGTKTDGKPWSLYTVEIVDGSKYSTFSKSMGEAAKTFCEKKTPCTITFEAKEKGNNLTEIVEHIDDGNAQE